MVSVNSSNVMFHEHLKRCTTTLTPLNDQSTLAHKDLGRRTTFEGHNKKEGKKARRNAMGDFATQADERH